MAGSTKGYSSHSLRKATHNVDNMTDVNWPFSVSAEDEICTIESALCFVIDRSCNSIYFFTLDI